MSKSLNIGRLTLSSGQVLPSVDVAYSTQGSLDADGRNAILVTHGFTSAHTMIEPGHHVAEGSWVPIIGPGLALDTDRWFIVCSNMLGSAAGTTGPRSINPATGHPWGPDFPDITLQDIVEVQHRLLQALGVTHLRAVMGPSYGGWQSLQWALDHPEMVDAIGVIASDFQHPQGQGKASQIARLAQSPQWHGGWYYDKGGMYDTLLGLRLQTLQSYGLETLYEQRYPDPDQRREAMQAPSRAWAEQFDANSMVALSGAAEHFNATHRIGDIRARTLMVQCTTDKVFPANPDSRRLLECIAAPTRYVTLDSPYGHMASGVELDKWQGEIAWLLQT
ncbi:MAG: alpha/beta fold hydrolase [Limnohabitans sp.]|nr:MAG: alpha/beta fold hydrolase [Limnohabitans sp.]